MRATLRVSGIDNVRVIKCDATEFNFDECGEISFALLDVDLYQPIADILPKLYSRLAPGGIIVVDDCAPSPKWEGALIAYREFVGVLGADSEILCGKLGIIRRPNGSDNAVGRSEIAA
jgi:predicted O-methyltransferase YrrM